MSNCGRRNRERAKGREWKGKRGEGKGGDWRRR